MERRSEQSDFINQQGDLKNLRCAIVTTRFIEGDMRGGEEAIRILVNNITEKHYVHLITSDMAQESYNPSFFSKAKPPLSNVVNEHLQITYLKNHYFAQRIFQVLDRTFYYTGLTRTKISEMVNTLAWGPLIPASYKIIANGDYDVVYSSIFPTTSSVLSFKAAMDSGIPFVFTPYYHFLIPKFRNSYLLRHMVRNSSATIACSELEREELVKLGSNESNTFVVPLSLDLSVIPKDIPSQEFLKERMKLKGYFVILTHPWVSKGGVKILRAASMLFKKGLNIAVVTIGKPEKNYLDQEHIIQLETPPLKIIDLGWVEGRIKWEIFSMCDIFALISDSDAFGLSYLDAMACKKPILGASGTPACEIIEDGVNGILVNPEDLEEIVLGLTRLVSVDRTILGKNGYSKLTTKYDPKKMTEAYINIFESVSHKN